MTSQARRDPPSSDLGGSASSPPMAQGPTVSQVMRHLAPSAEVSTEGAQLIGSDWMSELAPSLARAGLTVSGCSYSPREVVSYTDPNAVFLSHVRGDAGQSQIAIVAPASRGMARLTILDGLRARSRLVSPTALGRCMNLQSSAEAAAWGLVDRSRPLEALRTPPGRRPEPIRRLRQLIRLEKQSLRAVIVYALVVGVLSLATPLAVQALVNTIAFGTLLQPLVILAVLLLLGLLVAGGLRVLEIVVIEFIQRRLFTRTASDMAHRLTEVDLEGTRTTNLRELSNRFLDVAALQKVSASLLLDGLGLALQMAVGLTVLAFYHPLLLAFDVILVLLLVVVLRVIGRRAVQTAVSESKAKYAVLAWLEDMAASAMLLRVHRRSAAAIDRADHLTHEYLQAREEHFGRVVRQVIGLVLLQAVASAGLLGLGGWLVMTGQLTLGQLVASELILTAVVGSMAKFGKHLENFYDATAALDKVGSIIDLPMCEAKQVLPRQSGPSSLKLVDVTLENVEGREVLQGLNFELEPKTCVALTGAAGAGKSLLLASLAGLATPKQGDVRLGGDSLRRIGSVAAGEFIRLIRDTTLVAGTFLDNIRFYDAGISEADALALLQRLGGATLLADYRDGLHTAIEGGGQLLPTDLRTQLCVARELIGGPQVLLIDGVLDGVSPATKQAIMATLRDKERPWSVVIATHHPQIIDACDTRLEILGGGLQERSA